MDPVREGQQLRLQVWQPGRFLGQVNVAGLHDCSMCCHAGDLVALWAHRDGSKFTAALQILNEVHARGSILDQDDVRLVPMRFRDDLASELRILQSLAKNGDEIVVLGNRYRFPDGSLGRDPAHGGGR